MKNLFCCLFVILNFQVFGQTGMPATLKVSFVQEFADTAGASFVMKIPRNSRVAIILPGDYTLTNFLRNEIEHILKNSGRFTLIDQREVDLALSENRLQENMFVYPRERLPELGRRLGADIMIYGMLTDFAGSNEEFIEIILQSLSADSLEIINNAYGSLTWPGGEKIIYEQ
jgi:hypothetical protein